MDIIWAYLLKFVIYLVVTYLVAGFFVSLKRLLPFAVIIVSVATIIVSIFAYKYAAIRWIPVVLTVWAQIFYQGEDYMKVQVKENAYRLVSVERRWESLFAEYDKYELHFSPVETGGFLSNTLIYTLIFALVYGSSWGDVSHGWAFVVPIYLICMSIMDIFYLIGLPVTNLIHLPVKVIVCALAINIGFSGLPFYKPQPVKTEKLYKHCKEVAKVDYSQSYKMEYVIKTKSGYDYIVEDGFSFIYDSNLDAGAYSTIGDNPLYTSIIYKDFNSNNLLQYSSNSSERVEFEFDKYAVAVGGPFKYITIDQAFDTYVKFTESMFFDSTQIVVKDGVMHIYYDNDLDQGDYYNIAYSFNTNKKNKPTSVKQIICSVYEGDKKYVITYIPLSSKTELNDLFNEYKTLQHGYLYNDTEKYGIDLDSTISEHFMIEDVANRYDFTLKETYNGSSSMYVYDSDSELVGLYTRNYLDSYNAITNNDFYTYMPDYYINNDYQFIQDTRDWNITDPEKPFEKYTFDNGGATKIIKEGFLAFFDIMAEKVTVEDDTTIVTLVCMHGSISDSDFITYNLYYNEIDDEYEIYKVEVNTTYDNREYDLTMYYDDVFNLMY